MKSTKKSNYDRNVNRQRILNRPIMVVSTASDSFGIELYSTTVVDFNRANGGEYYNAYTT